MKRRKARPQTQTSAVDAFGLLGGHLMEFHEKLMAEGFSLPKDAKARRRNDGSWRIQLVWKRQDATRNLAVRRSVVMNADLEDGRIEPPVYTVKFRAVPGGTRAPEA